MNQLLGSYEAENKWSIRKEVFLSYEFQSDAPEIAFRVRRVLIYSSGKYKSVVQRGRSGFARGIKLRLFREWALLWRTGDVMMSYSSVSGGPNLHLMQQYNVNTSLLMRFECQKNMKFTLCNWNKQLYELPRLYNKMISTRIRKRNLYINNNLRRQTHKTYNMSANIQLSLQIT